MITKKFNDESEWMQARRGKITGSRLKDITPKKDGSKKIGFYELIAERISTAPDGEAPMERGHRLEAEAVERLGKQLKKKFDPSLVIWARSDDESIAVSPDAFAGKNVAVEVKCLSSARHIEAYLTQEVPDEYKLQTLQYFIVNDDLKTLYVAFYDPRIPCKDLFCLKFERETMEEDIAKYLTHQRETLVAVNEIVNELTKF